MGIFSYLRQFRLGEYTVIDTALSFVAVYFLAPLFSKGCRKLGAEVPRSSWLFFVLPVSILVHLLVRVDTPLARNFIDPHGHVIVKIVIIALVILGAKDIRIQKKRK
ncbi:MAG: hypothetical protein WC802_00525 [Patescibacteria group bacterium]|jgi:hypothetical protein